MAIRKASIVLVVVFSLELIALAAAELEEDVDCPDGWIPLHRGCYQFVTSTKQGWHEGNTICNDSNAQLTSIQSTKERDAINNYINQYHSNEDTWWVGFERKEVKGENWVWLAKGERVTRNLIKWKSRRQAARRGTVCGCLEFQHHGMKLSNNKCAKKMPFICEFHSISARSSTIDVTTTTSTRIPTTTYGQDNVEASANNKEERVIISKGKPETIPSEVDPSGRRDKEIVDDLDIHEDKGYVGLKAKEIESPTSTDDISETEEEGQDKRVTGPGTRFKSATPKKTKDEVDVNFETTVDSSPEAGGDENEEEINDGEDHTSTFLSTPATATNIPTTTEYTTTTIYSTTTTEYEEEDDDSPTVVDWHLQFRPYHGCYIPATGASLQEMVLTARDFYSNRKGEEICPRAKIRGLRWPRTDSGEEARVRCRRGQGFATFTCSEDPVCWRGEPDTTECASAKFQSLLKRIAKVQVTGVTSQGVNQTDQITATFSPPTVEETIEMTSQLVQVTSDEAEETTMDDVMVTSRVITALTRPSGNTRAVKHKKEIEEIVNNVVRAGSNLVSEKKQKMWDDMSNEDKVKSASSLLVAMETATTSMADELNEPTIHKQKDANVELELNVLDVEEFEKEDKTELVYDSEQSENSFSIPVKTLKRLSKGRLAKAVFITHYSMSDILGGRKRTRINRNTFAGTHSTHDSSRASDDPSNVNGEANVSEKDDAGFEGPKIATYIMSASIGGDGHITELPEPVTFTMGHVVEIDTNHIPLCSFWDISNGISQGFWSQEGCRVVRSNQTHTKCECDHMTNFAVLMDVHGVSMTSVHKSTLRTITIIGCCISCAALLASFITFSCFTSLQGERNSIHKNLTLCLLLAEILFVCGIDKVEHKVTCSVIAGFLHFMFLAAFMWMLMEGIHIIFMLVQVFDASRSRLPYYYLCGYGVPIVIVGASLLFYYEGYGTSEYCWLTSDYSFIWAFAGPVAVILLVNATFLSYALSTVCRHADYVFNTKEKNPGSGIRSWIQGALALEVLLGLTWVFGYFVLNDDYLPLAYIFTVLNSLQGLFIFIFHCLLSKKTQKEYSQVIRTVIPAGTFNRRASRSGTDSSNTRRTSNSNINNTGSSSNHHYRSRINSNGNASTIGHHNKKNNMNGEEEHHQRLYQEVEEDKTVAVINGTDRNDIIV